MKKITEKIIVAMLAVTLTVGFAGCSSQHYEQTQMPPQENAASIDSNKDAKNYGDMNGGFKGQVTVNKEDYSDTYFENYGVNPEVNVSEDSKSTFALDVDTASYTKARNYIEQGSLPPRDSIRVEEFVNYFKRHYNAPSNDTFSIYTEVAPSIFNKGRHIIEVGVQGKKVDVTEKKDSNLTFVIDVSGSMNMENRLGLVKKSLNMLVDQMGENDSIGIVVYGTKGRKLLNPTSGDNKKLIKEKINELEPEGSTNAAEGLKIGFKMANEIFDKNANNRIILCTDGVANQGLTDAEDILKTVEDYSKRGITLSSFGFGMDNYNDIFLEKLADKGDGNYSYIDSLEEAKKIFTEELTSILQVIAKDAKAQVEFDEKSVETYRLIGYENRDIKDHDFKNDSVDAGEIGAGHAVTALYEVKLKNTLDENLAVVKLRYKNPQTDEVEEISKTIKSSDVKEDFYEATPRFRFINMVAQFAEVLRNSRHVETDINEIYSLLDKDGKNLVENKEDSEFIELVKKARYMGENSQID
jgi:Ca-activated chloride channel family protein